MAEIKKAVMPHGYGWSPDGSSPSELSQFVVDAALAYQASGAVENNFVATGTRMFRQKKSYRDLLTSAIKMKFPQANVINGGRARTTAMEERKLARQVKRNGWTDVIVASVALGWHKERAASVAEKVSKKRSMKKRRVRFEVLSAEQILFDPAMHGGGDIGERSAAERREEFDRLKETERYKTMEQREEFSMRLERAHLSRITDIVTLIWHPPV